MEIILVSFILIVTLGLLISEGLSVDKTAVGIIVALALTGILTPRESVAGLANPAVVTVGAMFLLSRGLIRTGAIGFVTRLVLRFSGGNKNYAQFLILATVGVASAFINNTPVVVLFIPIVMGLSCEYEFSPSKLLIPLSYVSILAGTCTLIGTSTNIIVSDLSETRGFDPLTMFELGTIGLPIAILGLIYLMFASSKFLPGRTAPVCELSQGEEKRYLTELMVPEKSELIGNIAIVNHAEEALGLRVIELFRNGRIIDPARTAVSIQKGDILLVKASAEDLLSCLTKQTLKLAHGVENITFSGELKEDLILELVVPPKSPLLRERLISTELQNDPDIQVIAIRSRRSHYFDQKMQKVKLRVGDILLVRCPRNKVPVLRNSQDFIMIEEIHHAMIDREKARIAIAIFAGVVLSATFGLADIMVSALTGVFLMALTRCFSLKDAYRALDAEVLLLIVGTLALGLAMEKTGATKIYADLFLGLFKGMGPHTVLVGIIIFSSICTHILSNNATAVLLVPIAVSTALTLGVNPKPFIIGICFGASACFATPIGYQTNLLVYGPGGYRFSDYLKLGMPLNLLVIILSSIFIPMVWPL